MGQPHRSPEGDRGGAGTMGPVHRCRSRAQFFGILSLLWIFPSAGAVVILSMGPQSCSQAGSLIMALRGVRLEQWIAVAVLAVHPVLVWLAWRYRRFGPFREAMPPNAEPRLDAREPD